MPLESIWPGATHTRPMLCLPHSSASVLVSAPIPARAADECAMPAMPRVGHSTIETTRPVRLGIIHRRATALDQATGRVEVEPAHRPPAVRRDVLGRRDELAAGVVHEHVDAAEPLHARLDERVLHVVLADVALVHDAVGADQRARLLQRLEPAPGDHDAEAVPVQGKRDRPADAGAAAGDDRCALHGLNLPSPPGGSP